MPERQRTLRATVEWSVGLLDDAERTLLETAAVFVDGWPIEAAAQVADHAGGGVGGGLDDRGRRRSRRPGRGRDARPDRGPRPSQLDRDRRLRSRSQTP